MQRVEDVVALLRLAAHAPGALDADVGGAGQHLAEIGEDDADAAVGMLEEDHVPAERVVQRGMVEDQMRALGAGHEGLACRSTVGQQGQRFVQPCARGVDDRPRRDRQLFAGRPVRDREATRLRSQFGIVERDAAGREPLRVEDEFDAHALGMADPGVVVGGGEAQLRRQSRPDCQRRSRARGTDGGAAGGGGG